MTAYARQIASAKASIAKKGELCVWEKPAARDPAAKPWRDLRSGAADPNSVKIAWFQPDQQQFKFAQDNGGVPEGFEIGLMGAVSFTPEQGDPIFRSSGDQVTVWKLESLAPDGEPILWTVWIKR
jgi:hypothetical protein